MKLCQNKMLSFRLAGYGKAALTRISRIGFEHVRSTEFLPSVGHIESTTSISKVG